MGLLKKIIIGIFLFHCMIASQKSNNEKFFYGDFGKPATLDPITANALSANHLGQFLFDSLITQNAKGDFVFSLAKDLDISPDGLSYTFILKKNIKWADGSPLTSRDVEFTLALLHNPKTDNYQPTLAKYIEDVICISPFVITITLSRPFYSPLSLFTFKILPKHKFNENFLRKENAFCKKPIGCGPFSFIQNKGSLYLLRSNPFFDYRKKPFIKKVILKIYSKNSKAVHDLQKGKIHFVTRLEPKYIPIIEKNKSLVLQRYKNRTIHFIAFNHREQCQYRELFQDFRFRRALMYAIPRKNILKNIFLAGSSDFGIDGQAHSVISGPFPKDSWAYNNTIKPLPFDLTYAKELLREVLRRKGYSSDDKGYWFKDKKYITLSLKYPAGNASIEKACHKIVKNFNALGISVSLEKKEGKTFTSDIYFKHDFELAYMRYTFDSTVNAFPLFDPNRTGKRQSNFSGYVDSKLVELFYSLHNTLNPWSLRSISHKIHRVVHRDNVHLFLWQLDIYGAHQKKLKNFKLHPYYLFNFPENWKIIED